MPKFNSEKLAAIKKIDKLFKMVYFSPRNKTVRRAIINEDVRKILIVAPMMIGDTIMCIPALRVLKKNFPGASIILVCEQVVYTILEDQGLVDCFITMSTPWLHKDYSFKAIRQLFYSVKIVNKHKYDLAIDFRGDWRNIFLMNFLAAKRKVSFDFSGGEYMLTDVVNGKDDIKHYIDEWLYLLKSIGCKITEDDKYPLLKLSDVDKQFLNSFIEYHSLKGKFIIGMHPGASNPDRMWDPQKYAHVILNVSKKYNNCVFILFEGPNERQNIETITNILNTAPLEILVISESLKKYIALMSICDLIICNDSGAGHIAGALSKPSVILFGKSDPETVKPYNKNDVKIISYLDNLTSDKEVHSNKYYLDLITVEEVCEAIVCLKINCLLNKT